MRQARCHSFDFNPGDFLNDPNVLVMSFEERGAYISLLCRAWDLSVPGVLPGDEGVIRRLIGATPEEWDRVRSALRRCFDTSDGRWIQRRMSREYQAQSARIRSSDHQSRAGRARASRSSRDTNGKFASNHALTPAASSQSPAPPPLLPSTSSPLPPKEEPTLSSPDGDTRVADFMTAWQSYPHYGRRSSQAKSRQRWMALRPRPALWEVVSGIEAARATDDWVRESGRFVPAMEVWIGKRGWQSSDGAAVVMEISFQEQVRQRVKQMEAERGRVVAAAGAA